MKYNGIVIVGAGCAGLALAKEIRNLDAQVKITLLDKNPYWFPKEHYCRDLVSRQKPKPVYLNDFAAECQAEFFRRRIDRIQFNKKLIYCKDADPIPYQALVLACGAQSEPLSIKGEFRDGVFYFDNLDFFAVRDMLKISHDISIVAHTFLGINLAFALSFLGKEVRAFTNGCDFLGQEKEKIYDALHRRGVAVYDRIEIQEIIGESQVKAVKTSIPRVFSAQAVFIDSGFSASHKLLDFTPHSPPAFQVPHDDVYLLGDISDGRIENESFFFLRSKHIASSVRSLIRFISTGELQPTPPNEIDSQEIKKMLNDEFNVEKMASLV